MKGRVRFIFIAVCALLVAFAGYNMSVLPLWGWYPLLLLSSGWALIILLLAKRWSSHLSNNRFLLLSTLSGIFLSIGFPPSPLNIFLFVGFVPLLSIEYEISNSREFSNRWTVFKFAYNSFFIYNALTTWWVLNTSFLPGIFAITVNALFMALVFTGFHWVGKHFRTRLKYLAFIAFWICFEWIHTIWELSWPWLTLGNALAQFPQLIQWYEITGPFGGSLWILLINAMVFLYIRKRMDGGKLDAPGLPAILAIFIIPVVFSLYRYVSYPLESGDVEVAIVQPNFEPHYEKFNVPGSQQLLRFLEISDTLVSDSTDYLVFPETSFSFIHLNGMGTDRYVAAVKEMVNNHRDLHVVMGITSYRTFDEFPADLPSVRLQEGQGDTTYYDVQNAAVEVSIAEEIPYYFKSKLVPGAESFPYSDYLPFLRPIVDKLEGSTEGLTKQKERTVFSSGSASVAPVICYESIYGAFVGGYVKKGADMLFIITNDGWWDNTPGHIQHLKLGAMLAIEHRRPIARSANSGISCFVNERGDILQATGYEETAGIKRKLKPGKTITFYTRWGDMIARLSLFLSLMLIALFITRSLMPKDS